MFFSAIKIKVKFQETSFTNNQKTAFEINLTDNKKLNILFKNMNRFK